MARRSKQRCAYYGNSRESNGSHGNPAGIGAYTEFLGMGKRMVDRKWEGMGIFV